MSPAALLSLSLVTLLLAASPAAAAPVARGPGAAPPSQPRTAPAPDEDDDATPVPTARNAAPPRPARAGERRHRSYASCNRDSHKRSLHGGARRRFLIRCKLGYERRQNAPAAAAPATQPSQPAQGKRP